MDDMQAIEQRVTRELLRRAGPSEPVDDAAIFTAITAAHSARWRFQSPFRATKFVVAGAIVALFGGFLLAGVLTQPSEESVPAVGASASALPESAPVVTDAFDVGGYLDSLVGSHGAIWAAGGDGPVQRIDPVTREVTEVVPAGSGIRELVATSDAVWAAGASLMRIDPASAEVTDTLPMVAESLWPPPVADGSIWIGGDGVLYEVDIESRELVNEYVGHGGGWSAVVDGAIWLWGGEQGLVRFDLDTREFSDPFRVPALDWGYEECCVVAEDAIWLIAGPRELAMRFDLSTLEITDTIDLQRSGSTYPDEGVAVADAAWIPHGDGVIYRIDSQSREITDTIAVDGRPLDRLIFADGAIWVATRDTGMLHRIDPESRQVTRTIDVGGQPLALASSDGDIWVAGGGGIVTRVAVGANDAVETPERPTTSELPDADGTSAMDTTTPDLLPVVGLVTEEVEPGVFRVLSDGAGHDLVAEPPADVTVAPDHSVWLLRTDGDRSIPRGSRVDAVYRLGQDGTQQFEPADPSNEWWSDFAVDTEGVAWVAIGAGLDGATLGALDGTTWVAPTWPDGSAGVAGIEATADGAVWVTQSVEDDRGPRVARITDGEWTVLPVLEDPSRDGDFYGSGKYFAAAADGTAWLANGHFHTGRLEAAPRLRGLLHFDGTRWQVVDLPVDEAGRGTGLQQADDRWPWRAGMLALGSDGTLWVYLELRTQGRLTCKKPGYLARLRDGEWSLFDRSDGVSTLVCGQGPEAAMAVDGEGRLWVGGQGVNGVRSFDGSTWRHYLRGLNINRVRVMPDGSVIATALYDCAGDCGQVTEKVDWSRAGLYVITPEAVAGIE